VQHTTIELALKKAKTINWHPISGGFEHPQIRVSEGGNLTHIFFFFLPLHSLLPSPRAGDYRFTLAGIITQRQMCIQP
jgi:hypothetical protein